MCGISGIYNLNGSQVNKRLLMGMTNVIEHRGPDGFDYWYNINETLGFGHRRLAIIDLSYSGKQPMSGFGLTITFNGEIYNYLELKDMLAKQGYTFRTETDTEVILALYHKKGRECLDYLDGMFAFALWDEKKEELFCARDRFGEKPFYFYQDSEKFVFGSEIKQLFSAGIVKKVSTSMLYSYCKTDSLVNPQDHSETFFENIIQLPHGSYMYISKRRPQQVKRYWDIDYRKKKSEINLIEASERFNVLLLKSVTRRMRSDVPVGTSLSGGLDSTTIASSILNMQSLSRLKTFTASFIGYEKDETKYVNIFKKRYPQIEEHFVSPTAEDLVKDLEKLLFYNDEPVGSTSIYAQYRVMQTAKENQISVLLDGQGADEYLGGYNQFWPVRLREMFRSNDPNYLKEKLLVKELIGFEQKINANLTLLIKHPLLHKKLSELMRFLHKRKAAKVNSPLSPELTYDAFTSNHGNEIDWSDLNAVLYYSTFNDGLQTLLRYADRNSMAHSREVRLPFLSHELVEFVFSLPSAYKMNNGWSKYILRQSQNQFLPSEICWRREKVGYATPQTEWMKNPEVNALKEEKKGTLAKLHIFNDDFLKSVDSWKIFNLDNLLR
jgi:asparagine synthase (glutamine-hydrolysing)